MFNPEREMTMQEIDDSYPSTTEYEVGDLGDFVEEYESTSEEFDGDGSVHVLAGRVVQSRDFGGIAFFDINEGEHSVQIQMDASRTEDFEGRDIIQVGDIIEFTGEPIRSDSGELTLYADSFRSLSTALQHPIGSAYEESSQTFSDEERNRQRGRSLLWSEDLFNSVSTRFDVINTLRQYLIADGFQEVDTPILHTTYGGGQATPFSTYCEDLESDVYLRIAPELYLKRLLVGGYQQIFEIGPVFRNEDMDTTHHPEFTMMELYQAYADVSDMMELTERLVRNVVATVTEGDSAVIEYDGTTIDFESDWDIIDMRDAVNSEDIFNIPLEEVETDQLYTVVQEETGDTVNSRGEALLELYEHFVEGELIQPTFVVGFPPESTPLCKQGDDGTLERFEAVVGGMEIANAYSEQNNPLAQLEAFNRQSEMYSEDQEEFQQVDTEFIQDIGAGMPPTGGLGIGVDRVSQICADETGIKNVRPFVLTREDNSAQ